MASAAQRQAEYKQRMRKQGFALVAEWIRETDRAALRDFAKASREGTIPESGTSNDDEKIKAFLEAVAPIVEALDSEGSKNAATMSPPTIAYNTFKLRKLILELGGTSNTAPPEPEPEPERDPARPMPRFSEAERMASEAKAKAKAEAKRAPKPDRTEATAKAKATRERKQIELRQAYDEGEPATYFDKHGKRKEGRLLKRRIQPGESLPPAAITEVLIESSKGSVLKRVFINAWSGDLRLDLDQQIRKVRQRLNTLHPDTGGESADPVAFQATKEVLNLYRLHA